MTRSRIATPWLHATVSACPILSLRQSQDMAGALLLRRFLWTICTALGLRPVFMSANGRVHTIVSTPKMLVSIVQPPRYLHQPRSHPPPQPQHRQRRATPSTGGRTDWRAALQRVAASKCVPMGKRRGERYAMTGFRIQLRSVHAQVLEFPHSPQRRFKLLGAAPAQYTWTM